VPLSVLRDPGGAGGSCCATGGAWLFDQVCQITRCRRWSLPDTQLPQSVTECPLRVHDYLFTNWTATVVGIQTEQLQPMQQEQKNRCLLGAPLQMEFWWQCRWYGSQSGPGESPPQDLIYTSNLSNYTFKYYI